MGRRIAGPWLSVFYAIMALASAALLVFGWTPRVLETGAVTQRDLFSMLGYVVMIAAGCLVIGARVKN